MISWVLCLFVIPYVVNAFILPKIRFQQLSSWLSRKSSGRFNHQNLDLSFLVPSNQSSKYLGDLIKETHGLQLKEIYINNQTILSSQGQYPANIELNLIDLKSRQSKRSLRPNDYQKIPAYRIDLFDPRNEEEFPHFVQMNQYILKNYIDRLLGVIPRLPVELEAGEWSHFLSLTSSDLLLNNEFEKLPTLRKGVDAFELRVDLLSEQDADNIHAQIATIRSICPGVPIVYTVRTKGQLGKFDDEDYSGKSETMIKVSYLQ